MIVRVEVFRHQSRLLADNPLGDPPERDVGLILPPSYDAQPSRRYPLIVYLPGFTGTGLQLLNRAAWSPSLDRRLDDLYARGEAREHIVLLPDCFTRYGGSQYVDSPAIGRYAGYLTEELIPLVDARWRTIPRRESRGVIGKSSGGYGALALGMRRPEVFGAVASHAGDAAFDVSYQRELGHTAMFLEKKGGIDGFLRWFEELPQKPGPAIEVMSILCCAAAWSPSAEGPYAFGRGFDLPFDGRTAEILPDVWARWLREDPVRMLDEPRHREAMRSMRAIFLDAGLSDEYNLQLGARRLSDKLRAAGIAHTHEEFEGGHMSTQFRYARSFAAISQALEGE